MVAHKVKKLLNVEVVSNDATTDPCHIDVIIVPPITRTSTFELLFTTTPTWY